MNAKSDPRYALSGRIADRQGKPLAGLTVRAYDQDPKSADDALGKAVTSQGGRYTIRFATEQFKPGGVESGGPDLFIRVYQDDELLGQSPVRRNAGRQVSISLRVDLPADKEPPEATFQVSGAVRRTDGRPLANVTVRAFDQGLRTQSASLGKAKTDEEGRYTIGYEQKNLLDPQRGSANLRIEVVVQKGVHPTRSEIRHSARRRETINLTVDPDAGKSEWERLQDRLQPALKDVPLEDLSDDELDFVARSCRLPVERLRPARAAALAARQTGMPAWFHFALAQQGLPVEGEALLELPEARIQAALQAAEQAKAIPRPGEKELRMAQEHFRRLQADHALQKPPAGHRLPAQTLFELAGLPQDAQRQLARALIGHAPGLDGTVSLPDDSGLDEAQLKTVRLTLAMARLSDEHVGVVRALRVDTRVQSLRDLARLYDPQDWDRLVRGVAAKDDSDLPDDLRDGGDGRAAYARRLYARAANAYPTVAVAHGLARREGVKKVHPAVALLPRIVEADAAFDLGSTRLAPYITERRSDLSLTEEGAKAALDTLKGVQRLYRLRPEMPFIARLLEEPIEINGKRRALDSATAIVHIGKSIFVERYGSDAAFGRETAVAVYKAAEKVAARALGMYTRWNPAINTTPLPAAIGDCPTALQGVPDWPALFGTLDGCDCEPCESVYGPAAYLTDLLAFLEREIGPIPDFQPRQLVPTDGLAALAERSYCDAADQLVTRRARRPDITRTLLSCRNAETELPYVDLVLEIMENAVAPRRGGGTLQTTLPAEQLAAQGEHFNADAYVTLRKAIFPLSLPFDLWHEEESIYLNKLGTSRVELLETLFPFQATSTPDQDPHDLTEIRRWQDREISQACLGLADNEWRLIAGLPIPPATVVLAAEPWGFSFTAGATWWHPLRTADVFLTRSGLTYAEMLRLFALRSFNPTGSIGIDAKSLNECDPKKIQIKGLSVAVLGFLHRFLRLQRALGWTSRELDQALRAISLPPNAQARPALDEAFLIRLAHLLRLRDRFHLPVDVLAGWWAPLDTQAYRAAQLPHEQVAPPLYERLFLSGRPGEPEYEAFLLNAASTELAKPQQLLHEHLLSIAGALRLTLPDLQRLLDDLAAAFVKNGQGNPRLNLANLSLLFRHASLARALGLRIEEYLSLKKLIGFDPFAPVQLTANEHLGGSLQTLRFVTRVEFVRESGFTIDELDYLLRQTMPFSGKTVAPTEKWVQESLYRLKQLGAQTSDLASSLAEILALPVAVCTALLDHTPLPADGALTAKDALLAALAPDALPQDHHGRLTELIYRLHKAAMVIDRLGIQVHELVDDADKPRYLSMRGTAGWLHVLGLPGTSADSAAPFDGWMRTVGLFHFRDMLLPEQQEHLFGLFDIATQYQAGITPYANQERQAYYGALATLSGWSADDLTTLVGKFDIGAISHGGGILQASFPHHFADERLPHRVLTAIQLTRRLGASAAAVQDWYGTPLGQVHPGARTARIKNVLKARYGDDWAEAIKPLRDPLRERQRQALVTYLLHEWKQERADDLFDHFLIDVEMSPCMMTSRLIQATAAVQLFVQRVVMNLEPGLALSEAGAEQWDWMKNYQVWAANRKVFLYPENWIEPELRDDKTPFFKDLENELLQADITNETAETALLHYLEKLNEVARPQVCGQYLQAGNPPILHVFARTRDVPHHYYYRWAELHVSERSFHFSWSPWERVDVDIEGDHLIPIVYNRRLYLFWPIFTSEDEAPLTHLMQQLMAVFGKLLKLQERIGALLQGLFQGVGAGVVAGLTNGLIQLLEGLSVGDGLQGIQNEVRKIRQQLLKVLGIDESWKSAAYPDTPPQERKEKFDETWRIVNKLDLPDLDDLSSVFEDIGNLIASFQEHLLQLLPAKRLEVQLAWSEFKGDSWTAKKTSSGVVTFRDVVSTFFESLPQLPGLGSKGVRRLFTFRGEVDHVYNHLRIHCNVALPQSLLSGGPSADGSWLSEPKSIGYFQLNGCNGVLEAIDTEESLNLVDLFSQGISQFLGDMQDLEDQLATLGNDRQLQQRGVPITPDDDPDRASTFRELLDTGVSNGQQVIARIPRHYFPPYPDPVDAQSVDANKEDAYRVLARHQESSDLARLVLLFYQDSPVTTADIQQDDPLARSVLFFYQDSRRTFLCFPMVTSHGKSARFVFFPFYHPYTCALLENLQRAGIRGIYQDRYVRGVGGLRLPYQGETGDTLQVLLDDDTFFKKEYYPQNVVESVDRALRPIEQFDFSTIGAYAQYNWEIFFHIPLLIAARLSTNQKFREAQHWFHYIFDPTDASRGEAPAKYWRTKPFVQRMEAEYTEQDIDTLLRLLNGEAEIPDLQEIERAVQRWRQDAFNPHLIARTRGVAFQKTVVMKYIDNLIAWADALFRRETREAVNEAMQLYILAAKLLGPRPRRIPRSAQRAEKSFEQLRDGLDTFSNALVELENHLAGNAIPLDIGLFGNAGSGMGLEAKGRLAGTTLAPVDQAIHDLVQSPSLRDVTRQPGESSLYFCVPPNDKLLDKWDIVADRLFKVRHCQNIEGQTLTLSLLSPPIDPALLVRAAAEGIAIEDVLEQLESPPPQYRFQVLLQKATELCGEVKSLGAALLSAIEKRDGEEMAWLRNTQELGVLKAMQNVKVKQIDEAREALAGLECVRASTTLKRDHYQRLLNEFMNPEELVSAALNSASLLLQISQFGVTWGASAASLLPNIKAGFVTTLGGTYGGENLKGAAENAAAAIGQLASIVSSTSGMVSTMGGYRRRAEDWLLQVQLAEKELCDLETKIVAANLRCEIAELELANHKLQIRNNQDIQAFMQKKFSSQELYGWMVNQLSVVYHEAYKLAYGVAQKAERALAFELGEEHHVLRFGYWDDLRKGLLAGETLHQALKRLELVYLEENRREYEITRHVSLLALDPLALIRLRETGTTEFGIPEALFDMDFPGHFMRRIKSVSLSIPCITGPYTGVSATLRLLKSRVRQTPQLNGLGYLPANANDSRFRTYYSATRAVATSTGQNDSGLFELNLRDERFLPFEGEGVDSQWELKISKEFAQFDLDTISDVVLHIRYTAREGGESLRAAALQSLDDLQHALTTTIGGRAQPMTRLFSVRHEFATEWHRFKTQTPLGGQRHELALELRPEHYPFWAQGRLNSVSQVDVLARSEQAGLEVADKADTNDGAAKKDTLAKDAALGNLFSGTLSNTAPLAQPTGELKLYFDSANISDLWLAVTWSIQP